MNIYIVIYIYYNIYIYIYKLYSSLSWQVVLHRLAALAFRTWRYNVVQWCMFCVPVAHSQVELANVLSHPSQLFGQDLQSGTKYA